MMTLGDEDDVIFIRSGIVVIKGVIAMCNKTCKKMKNLDTDINLNSEINIDRITCNSELD